MGGEEFPLVGGGGGGLGDDTVGWEEGGGAEASGRDDEAKTEGELESELTTLPG
jgi:hypothetical protein